MWERVCVLVLPDCLFIPLCLRVCAIAMYLHECSMCPSLSPKISLIGVLAQFYN